MMTLTQENIPNNRQVICAYGNQFFKTQQAEYQGNIIVYQDQVIENQLPMTFNELNHDHFKHWISFNPEIILLGCGDKQMFLEMENQFEFIKHNISLNVMTTPAACRTFSILSGEERNVMAILFAL